MKRTKVEKPSELKNNMPNIDGIKVWLDAKGQLCLGTDCFFIRQDKDKVVVVVGESCPVTVEKIQSSEEK